MMAREVLHPFANSAGALRAIVFSCLAMVCANCHRMLHRRRDLTLAELSKSKQASRHLANVCPAYSRTEKPPTGKPGRWLYHL